MAERFDLACEGEGCVYMQLAAEARCRGRFTGRELAEKVEACSSSKRVHEGRVPCGLAAARVCIVSYQEAERSEAEAMRRMFGGGTLEVPSGI